MKNVFRAFLLTVILSPYLQAQSNYECLATDSSSSGQQYAMMATNLIPKIGTVNAMAIYATPQNTYDATLPVWVTSIQQMSTFLYTASFGQHILSVDIISQDPSTCFVSAYNVNHPTDLVVSRAFVIDILGQVDAVYDYGQYDNDGPDGIPNSGDDDGYVDMIFFNVINYPGNIPSRGTVDWLAGGIWTSADPAYNGGYIMVRDSPSTIQRFRNPDHNLAIPIHEYGHLFDFPDMDHQYLTYFNHYSLGDFDVMSTGGFQDVASLYNPWFRESVGWISPTYLSSDRVNQTIRDFNETGDLFRRIPNNPPSNTASSQSWYCSYHRKRNNWERNFPIDNEGGGMLLWHTQKDVPERYDAYLYADRRKTPVDLEQASGKWIWSGTTNTFVPNALTGLDSLEVRGSYDTSPDNGSNGCFFLPGKDQEFAFYTNPNSNYYHSSSSLNYAQSITSGFAVKNLVRNGSTTTVDLYVNEYRVTKNATLHSGTWYVHGNIEVQAGITFRMQSGCNMTIPSGLDIKLASGSTLVLESGSTLVFESGGTLTLDGGTILNEGTGNLVFEGSRGLRGSGAIISANITWVHGFDVRDGQTLVFQNGGIFSFDCAQANRPQYIINNGNITFQGSSNPYVFGDCLDEIRNYDNGTFITQAGTTLQHLPTVISWDNAVMQSNGTQQGPCQWLFRYGAGLDDYTSLTATRTTFGGSTWSGIPPDEWEGILVGDVNSWIDLDYCTVQDVFVNPGSSGSGIHFYQSGVQYISRIKNSRILRNTGGQNKNGDGIFLQPGNKFSYVKLECSEINQDWYTGFTSVGSYPRIFDSRIFNNLVGIGLSVSTILDLKRSCIEGHVFEGVDINASELSFTSQNTAGGNRIVNNANQQLDVNNNSVLYGGWDPAGGSSYRGHDNNISSMSSAWVVQGDGTGTAWLQKNWFGVVPGIYDPQTGLCYLTPTQASQLFNNVTVHYDPAHCNEILPNCSTECPEWFQNPGGGVASFSKASALPPFASSLRQLRAYAQAGNFAEVYRFIGTLMPNNVSAQLAKRYATFVMLLENEHVRNNPDTLSVSRSRLNAFLLNRFSASNQAATKAALLNVLARSLFALEDIDGADYRINQLRNQYSNSPYATDILPVLQLVAMAQRDSVKMNNAIAHMQSANFPASEMRLARTMKRAYHRFRPQSPYPKNVVYDGATDTTPVSASLAVRNYPNPFNPSTVIEYTLPKTGYVTLRVYDLLGREAASLVNEEQPEGVHSAVFTASASNPSGLYLYVLSTPSGQVTGRMILAK